MPNIIIIHGAKGNPKDNWFPWLKTELEAFNCHLFIPSFPTPENQSLTNWINVFEKYQKYLDESSIVIGHSLGCAFLLSVLENLKTPIKAALLVAGFTGLLGNKEFDNLNKTFTAKSFNWPKIKQNCQKFYIISSDNDPYVPLQKGQDLAKNTGSKLIVIKNAGHFNEDAGYTKFELLLRKIKKLI